MFRIVPLYIIRSFLLYTQQWYMSYRLQLQLASRIRTELQFRPDPARKLSANLYDINHRCVYKWKTPGDGQRNCPKRVEFYSKNKFDKLLHLLGFITRINFTPNTLTFFRPSSGNFKIYCCKATRWTAVWPACSFWRGTWLSIAD